MDYRNYRITSYDEYYKKYMPEIKSLCKNKQVHVAYIMALNEAVCNAFRYNKCGEYKGTVDFNMIVSDSDIVTRIHSDTMPFNAVAYYEKIQELAQNSKTKDMEWGIYTLEQEGGRGLWYMLYGSDALQLDITSHEVTLFIAYPSAGTDRNKKIKDLAKKFYLKKNGVVL